MQVRQIKTIFSDKTSILHWTHVQWLEFLKFEKVWSIEQQNVGMKTTKMAVGLDFTIYILLSSHKSLVTIDSVKVFT